jgi:ribosomal protein S18 acetylase RimI-like enzyme
VTVQGVEIDIRRADRQDRTTVLSMLTESGFFRQTELKIAEEVFDDAVANGPGGDYQSFICYQQDKPLGWICFGPTPCTVGAYDIYWLIVEPQKQRKGIGSVLMRFATDIIKDSRGRMIVVETSGSDRYGPTRKFYERMGFSQAAVVKDFYSAGDDKVIYVKFV